MNLKNIFRMPVLAFLGLLAIPGALPARQAPTRTIRVNYDGGHPYVRIFINNRYTGKVINKSFADFRMAPGQNYSIRATYGGKSHTESIYLRRGSTQLHNIRFSLPRRDEKTEAIKNKAILTISYKGQHPHALVFINNNPQGKIIRNTSRTFDIQVERGYTIRVSAEGLSTEQVVRATASGKRKVDVIFYTP